MARSMASLPGGTRLSDVMSVTLLAATYPVAEVERVLLETGRCSQRRRLLPAPMMVYYVMALALYAQVSYEEVLRLIVTTFGQMARWRWCPTVPAKSSIAEARQRLGSEPLRLLCERMVVPVATENTQGAWYRRWRVVSLDGCCLDVADTDANVSAFGRPGVSRGAGSAFPKLRFCTLLECGTHVLFGANPGPFATGETVLAEDVVSQLKPGMLCLADRNFFSYRLWSRAADTGADMLWRAKADLLLTCEQLLADGSYLTTVYPTTKSRRHRQSGVRVRVIAYRLAGDGAPSDGQYRLMTTILDPDAAPALELAAIYSERWEIETTLDEFKTHLRGSRVVLRSKTPDGVYQEFWGFLLAHHVVRALMHDAALKAGEDPDRMSYKHSLAVLRQRILEFVVTPPSALEPVL